MKGIDLRFGNCLDVLSEIPDQSVDLIFSDLPYGTTRCKWDSLLDLDALWKHYKRIRKPNAAAILFAQVPFNIILGASNIEELRYEWIWEKTNATGHLNARRAPMKAHENIMLFYKNPPAYNPIKTTGHKRKISTADHKRNTKQSHVYGASKNTGYDSTERYPRSIIKFPSDKQKTALHPTQKPVALCEYLIKTYSSKGDIVLDSCMGSGSIGKACINTGRRFIGIENDITSFETSTNRLLITEPI